jgi:hypothetical protein
MIACVNQSSPIPSAEFVQKNDYTYFTCCCWCGNEAKCGHLLVKGRHYAEALCDRCADCFLGPEPPFDWLKDGF